MTWEDIVKNREIKIPKRKKGNVDPSRFMMSKPAMRDNSEIKREQVKIRLQAYMTETYKNIYENELITPHKEVHRLYWKLGDMEMNFNRKLKFAEEDGISQEEYYKLLEKLQAEDESEVERIGKEILKYSRNLRNLIGLKGGNLDNKQHIKTLKTEIYNRFNDYFDNKPMRMDKEEYEMAKPLVNQIKLTREQNVTLEYELAEYKYDMKEALRRLNQEIPRRSRREVRNELTLYENVEDSRHPNRIKNTKERESFFKSESWQTVLKRRPVEKRVLSRKIVDLGMPIALAREIINSLDTSEVKKYGRMIEVMEDRTIKKAIDMYLKKRQEADRKMSSLEGTTFAREEYFTTTPENARAYSRYFLHLLETV